MSKVIQGDCLEVMKDIPDGSIDMVITSPPYDNMRSYNDSLVWGSDIWEEAIQQLHRVTKDGGCVVWVTGDATIKGSETGSSFKQALYFMESGFNLHDTMIWQKTGMLPTQDRYYNQFEYMFVFSKGKPSAMNFICDHKTVNGGRRQRKDAVINKGSNKKGDGYFIRNEYARRPNVWKINIGNNKKVHPAVFPLQLAQDHIATWSNEGDTILDPFAGSGTTAIAAINTNRKYILIEKEPEYIEIINKRIEEQN